MRKLTMLAASALAVLAFAGMSATSASAATFKLWDLEETFDFCPSVSLNGTAVSGGCSIEDFDGSFDLGMFTPGWNPVGSYDSTFDLVLDSNGDGYAINPTITLTQGALGRAPCDQANGTVLPWAVNSHSQQWRELEMDITFGIRTAASGPGGACTHQVITVQTNEPWEFEPTELDQANPSANVDNAHWDSPNSLNVDFDSSYEESDLSYWD